MASVMPGIVQNVKVFHDGVNGVVLQRDSFSWKVQKFYIDLRSPPLGLGQPNHSGVWFQRVDLAYS